jgi:hypothetical protein
MHKVEKVDGDGTICTEIFARDLRYRDVGVKKVKPEKKEEPAKGKKGVK